MTHGEVVVNVSELTKIDQFKLLNTINTDKEIQGCYMSDLLSWVMGHAKRGECWITIMSHLNIVAVASLLALLAIVTLVLKSLVEWRHARELKAGAEVPAEPIGVNTAPVAAAA